MCFNLSHKMSPGITFHRFPMDEMLRNAWLKNLNRENRQPSATNLLCSKHFEAHLFDRTGFRTILARGAIPTLFEEVSTILFFLFSAGLLPLPTVWPFLNRVPYVYSSL